MKRIEPDGILYHTETALDKLTDLIISMKGKKKRPTFYVDILDRRINLTNYAKQLRGTFHGDIKDN